MGRYRVVVTDQVFPTLDIEREVLAEIDADIEVAAGSAEEVLARARRADALLNTYLGLDARFIDELEQCKIIARYGIGVDNIDVDAARQAGVIVTNVPDYCIEEVSVHALGLTLALHRGLVQADALVRAGGWGISALRPISRVSELTVGIVGFGQIGRRVSELFHHLGATIIAYDPYVDLPAPPAVSFTSFDELVETADVVSLHCPLTPETRGLIARPQLERMRDDAQLVNTSRGPLVVLADLLDALRTGTIRGAALDVYEQEPPDPTQLHQVPRLLLTPHMAFYSDAALRDAQTKAASQVIKALNGKPVDYPVAN